MSAARSHECERDTHTHTHRIVLFVLWKRKNKCTLPFCHIHTIWWILLSFLMDSLLFSYDELYFLYVTVCVRARSFVSITKFTTAQAKSIETNIVVKMNRATNANWTNKRNGNVEIQSKTYECVLVFFDVAVKSFSLSVQETKFCVVLAFCELFSWNQRRKCLFV